MLNIILFMLNISKQRKRSIRKDMKWNNKKLNNNRILIQSTKQWQENIKKKNIYIEKDKIKSPKLLREKIFRISFSFWISNLKKKTHYKKNLFDRFLEKK